MHNLYGPLGGILGRGSLSLMHLALDTLRTVLVREAELGSSLEAPGF